jgi:amino acid adenylation domain-containing protein/non-ribosomal peptide synthase protein (TIGR01720 family)
VIVYQSKEEVDIAIEFGNVHLCDYRLDIGYGVAKFDMSFGFEEHSEGMYYSLNYNTDIYSEEQVKRMLSHLEQLLETISTQTQTAITAYDILTQEEKTYLLETLNDTKADYPKDKTIVDLFEEQVKHTPENTALKFKDKELSYRELNEQANQLAHYLIQNYTIQPDELIGIELERSEWMVIGILAIIKSGGAYVPIDPEYPKQRKSFIKEDANLKLIINEQELQKFKEANKNKEYPSTNPNIKLSPNNLMYVIYTSGSTGNPKGCMLEHGGLVNRLTTIWHTLNFGNDERILQSTTFTFDVSLSELIMPLLKGASSILIDKNTLLNPKELVALIHKERVTSIHAVPGLLDLLIDDNYFINGNYKELRRAVSAGEPLSESLLQDWHNKTGISLFNYYGPTETSIYVLGYQTDSSDNSVHIGKPLPNTQAYLLDNTHHLVPFGSIGEICIGGVGLARGYLNREDLTKEKFITNPYNPSERLYRTGDLGRWREDGNLEYLGRIDDQVKIRGYRIELGEIEQAISSHKASGQAVVIARAINNATDKELIAYTTGEATAEELKSYLKERLPSYMVPNYYVKLESIPLTSNGKVDRKALPDPEGTGMQQATYIAPTTETEKQLVEIWSEVLRAKEEEIGLESDFFALGGDSIKAIQIVARLRNAGYELKISDVMGSSRLQDMATKLKPLSRKIDQGAVEGEVVLSPIQRAFLANAFAKGSIAEKQLFHQSFMLCFSGGLNIEETRVIIEKLIAHHDVLRMRYEQTEEGEWKQYNGGLQGDYYVLEEVSLPISIKDQQKKESFFAAQGNSLKQRIGFKEGPLLGVGLYHDTEANESHLLLSIHHIVIDLVSWRILFEDIDTLLNQYRKGKKLTLPEKTDSYRYWMEQSKEYAQGYLLERQRTYWEQKQTAKTDTIPVQDTKGKNTFAVSKRVGFVLSKEETALVQQGMNAKNKVETNAMLLAALSRALKNIFGVEQVRVLLEGHGREEYLEQTDISRTVGWFTSMYPFVLSSKQETIESVLLLQDSLTQVPDKGVGYGPLRYLSDNPLPQMEDAQVTFNYLGDFTREEKDKTDTASTPIKQSATKNTTNNTFSYSAYSHGLDVHPNLIRESELEVSGQSENGCLQMSIQYSAARMNAQQMQQLAEQYKAQLLKLSEELVQYDKTLQLPGSFTYKGLSLEQITALSKEYGEIEDVYRLSPMQQGLYYHALSEPKSHAYFEQFGYGLKGELDIAKLEQAYRTLIARHGVLRTVFRNDLAEEPLQVVLKEGIVDFRVEDIQDKSPNEQQAYIKALRETDKDEGFDLSAGPLVRLIIIKLSENRFYQIWSNHHLNLDGWSTNAVLYEFDVLYKSLINNQPTTLPNLEPYSRYIAWLGGIDQQKSKAYWNHYLTDYDSKAVLPFDKEDVTQHTGYLPKDYEFWLSEELSNKLNAIAQKEKTTLNTIVQSAWGILLSRYNNTQDVVFGSVVSGRPSELKGIQEMIGIFINTVPQRIRYTDQTTFSELLQQTQQSFIAGEPHHHLNLAEIQHESELGTNLIDHLVVFENYPISGQTDATNSEEQPNQKGELSIQGDTVEWFEQMNYDFTLMAAPEDRLFFRMKYNGAKYSEGFIKRLEGQWKQLLGEIAKSTQTAINGYDILTQEEKTYLIDTLNDTKADYPKDKTIVDLFEEQVKLNPENTALKFNGKELSYRELNEQSNELAHYLIQNYNIQPDELVGIELERSEWMVIGILAIIKSGGAYVPIDPEYPQQRKDFIKQDSRMLFCLDQVMIDNFKKELDTLSTERPSVGLKPQHLVYATYTSGSTGTPKGVAIEHMQLSAFLSLNRELFFSSIDESVHSNWFAVTNYTFDISVFELLGSLVYGFTLNLNPIGNSEYLLNSIANSFNGVLQITPSYFEQLIENENAPDVLKRLDTILIGGEAMSEIVFSFVKQYLPDVNVFNVYGPTEATIWSTSFKLNDANKVQLGSPLANESIFILNQDLQLVPYGSIGEICIGGAGLARGYLNRPELNQRKIHHQSLQPY